MYKLEISAKDTDHLSIGFDQDRTRRQQGLTDNRIVKGKFHVRIMLKKIFGFGQCQEKADCELGYKLKLTRIKDNAVLNKAPRIDEA